MLNTIGRVVLKKESSPFPRKTVLLKSDIKVSRHREHLLTRLILGGRFHLEPMGGGLNHIGDRSGLRAID
jgi:hypothetical protein